MPNTAGLKHQKQKQENTQTHIVSNIQCLMAL